MGIANKVWRLWCKSIGSHAYDDNLKNDWMHLTIRTVWFALHIVTCVAIITNTWRHF